MVETENEQYFVCVEDQVARETRVLQLFEGIFRNLEGIAEY